MSNDNELYIVIAIFLIFGVIYVALPLIFWGISVSIYPKNIHLLQKAKQRLSGNWTDPVLAVLLSYAVMCGIIILIQMILGITQFVVTIFAEIVNSFSETALIGVVILAFIVFIAISIISTIAIFAVYGGVIQGACSYFLKFSRNEPVQILDILAPFKSKKQVQRSSSAYFLMALYISLWSLLFVIPGIVAGYSYAMIFFILSEDENCSINDALKRSKEMMFGHRAELFWLFCRFIGWGILGVFTMGVGYLWLMPYVMIAMSEFYNKIKNGSVGKKVFIDTQI
jgi:uncharacterized membrane protein